MKRVRVVVEVDVPDAAPLTEKQLAWAVRRALPADGHITNNAGWRRFDVKEFRRVMEFQPGGIRNR